MSFFRCQFSVFLGFCNKIHWRDFLIIKKKKEKWRQKISVIFVGVTTETSQTTPLNNWKEEKKKGATHWFLFLAPLFFLS